MLGLVKSLVHQKVLLLISLLLAFACIVTFFNRTIASTSVPLNNRYVSDDITIELISANEQHHALKNSQFMLKLTTPSSSELQASSSLVAEINQQPILPELNDASITLQMLYMNCGTVTVHPQKDSSNGSTYIVEAAPLMKGVWVATATFELDNEIIALSYQFDVS